MKKITFILFFALTSFMANAQIITNGDFETAGTIKRVTNFYDAAIQGTNPTATAGEAVAAGQWVKRALDDAKATAVITTGGHTANCLNLKIATTNNAAYTNSLAFLAVQKLTGLDNTKRYLVTFWAKQDATTTNNCHGVNVVLGDNVVKSLSAPLTVGTMLTGGVNWTQYTVVLDLPKYIVSNPTADFSTAEFGFAITVKATTAAAGILIDDVVMTELTTPTVAYVKPVASGTGDGSSWENASADIQTAINSLIYGEVRVAAGTYTPDATISLKDGVNLMGAYAADGSGTRDIWNNKTILDGAGTKRIIMNSSSSNPFKYATMVNGFILQNGYSDLGSAASLSLGAVLENCIIRNNTGTTKGAAVYFSRNTSISGSAYSTNYQAAGSLINCLIINNSSTGGAGAVYGDANSLFGIVNCVIANNTCSEATTGTGGLYIGLSDQWFHLQNSIFYNNSGATTALNNVKNATTTTLSATLNNWFSDATMPLTYTAGKLSANNKSAADVATPGFELPTSFQGATTDPAKLAEYETCNWRLKSTSGLIGLGNATQNLRVPYENINAIVLVTTGGRAYTDIATDLMGSARVINTTADLGVYEYNPVVVTALSSDDTKGTVAGGITVSKGTSVTLTSSPASGQKLIDWNDGVSDVSTAVDYTFVPMADVTVTATFDVISGLSKNIQDNFVTVDGRNITIKGEGTIEIYSAVGKLVLKQALNGSVVSLGDNGIYLVKVSNAKGVKIQKIVVR
jgi:hypothetical protein